LRAGSCHSWGSCLHSAILWPRFIPSLLVPLLTVAPSFPAFVATFSGPWRTWMLVLRFCGARWRAAGCGVLLPCAAAAAPPPPRLPPAGWVHRWLLRCISPRKAGPPHLPTCPTHCPYCFFPCTYVPGTSAILPAGRFACIFRCLLARAVPFAAMANAGLPALCLPCALHWRNGCGAPGLISAGTRLLGAVSLLWCWCAFRSSPCLPGAGRGSFPRSLHLSRTARTGLVGLRFAGACA